MSSFWYIYVCVPLYKCKCIHTHTHTHTCRHILHFYLHCRLPFLPYSFEGRILSLLDLANSKNIRLLVLVWLLYIFDDAFWIQQTQSYRIHDVYLNYLTCLFIHSLIYSFITFENIVYIWHKVPCAMDQLMPLSVIPYETSHLKGRDVLWNVMLVLASAFINNFSFKSMIEVAWKVY